MKLERGRTLKEANAQIKSEQTSKQKLLWWLIAIGSTAIFLVVALYIYNKRKARRLIEAGEYLQKALEKSKEEQELVENELERIKEKIRISAPEEERQAPVGEERELKLSTEMQENITQALQLLMEEQHLYRDKNLTLESLSNTIDINRSYMSIYLNRIVGCNFYEYVAKLRLKEAKRLLCNTDYTLQVIANETGFSTMQTFHNVFKKYNNGQTPTEYRNRCTEV